MPTIETTKRKSYPSAAPRFAKLSVKKYESGGLMDFDMEEFPTTTSKSRGLLGEIELVDYRSHREEFIRWLLYLGKNPDNAEGYSRDTVKNTAYRTEQMNRWS